MIAEHPLPRSILMSPPQVEMATLLYLPWRYTSPGFVTAYKHQTRLPQYYTARPMRVLVSPVYPEPVFEC